jgi:uncharacterized phage-associated protein
MKPVITNIYQIAAWFESQALASGQSFPMLKMHVLLFLADSMYFLETAGGMLFPAHFLVDADKLYEPTLYYGATTGSFREHAQPLPRPVQKFLMRVWDKYGAMETNRLLAAIYDSAPVKEALRHGPGSLAQVSLPEQNLAAAQQDQGTLMHSVATGQAVKVKKWQPRKKS